MKAIKTGITDHGFTEFHDSHTDNNGVTFIDGYKPDGQGEVIAHIFNGSVYPCNPDFRLDRVIVNAISEMGYIW